MKFTMTLMTIFGLVLSISAQARNTCDVQAERAASVFLASIHQSYEDFSHAIVTNQTEVPDADGKMVTTTFKIIAKFIQGSRPIQLAPQEWEAVARSEKDADRSECEMISVRKVRDLPADSSGPEQR